MDLTRFKEAQVKIWELGDYPPVGEMLTPAARLLVEAAGVRSGQSVLDVGTGSGSVAVVAAQAGAEVTGVDITDAWFEDAHSLARQAGVEISLQLGDAEDLPFEDESFDAVLSSFAAIFAPRHGVVADELVRVCRPGGTIGLNAWTPEGKNNQMFSVLTEELPNPPDFVEPSIEWGDPDHVRSLFAPHGLDLSFDYPTMPVAFASIEEFESFALDNSGGFIRAREILTENGKWEATRAKLRQEMEALNEAGDAGFRMTWDFLRVIGTKP